MNTPNPLTSAQEQYIRDHFENMHHQVMADNLKIKVHRVSAFCLRENLRKRISATRNVFAMPLSVKKKTGKHWPADHTNLSCEQYIDRILNMEL